MLLGQKRTQRQRAQGGSNGIRQIYLNNEDISVVVVSRIFHKIKA